MGKSTLFNTLLQTTVIPAIRNRDSADFETAVYYGTRTEGGVTLDIEVTEILGYGSERLADRNYSSKIVEFLRQRHLECHKMESAFPRGNGAERLVHSVFYFVPPTFMQFSADEILLFKELQQMSLLVPLISKADIYTAHELKEKKLLVNTTRSQFDLLDQSSI